MTDKQLSTVLSRVAGFRSAGVHCGVKKFRLDLGLLVCDSACPTAMVITRNRFRAAPLEVSRSHLATTHGLARAVVVNSGNANACTGEQGLADAYAMAEDTARVLGCQRQQVLVSSTGVIGHPLPMARISEGISAAARQLSEARDELFAQAIMTTDQFPKSAQASFEYNGNSYYLGGVVKGAGMIHPNMATMLSYLVTNARVRPKWLQSALQRATDRSFNCLSVDGDTSTNDTVILMAHSQPDSPFVEDTPGLAELFEQALLEVCVQLTCQIALDGEGATKVITVRVHGAEDNHQALQVARTVVTSLLVKTAIFGCDPNWGRIIAAIGRSDASFDPDEVRVCLNGVAVFHHHVPIPFDRDGLSEQLRQTQEVAIDITLGSGSGIATVYGSDLTYEYVKINAEYHT